MAEVHTHIFCTADAPFIEFHYPEQYKRTQKLKDAHLLEIAEFYEGFRSDKSDKRIRIWDAQNKSKLPGELLTSNIRPKYKDINLPDSADVVYRKYLTN